MHSPNYSFRDNEDPVAFQVWPRDEESALLHPQCAETPNENEFPLYADDVEAGRCLEPILCDKCDGLIAEPLPEEPMPIPAYLV
jgi:hypothetical protein